jgi:TolB-like protein/Tfp pilus assembly protein PilF
LSTLFSEFRRRNVFRVAALYLVSAWLIAQVADVVIGLGELPPAVGRVILVILALGFPVAIALAWFFEWTSEGIRREAEAAAAPPVSQPGRRRLDYVILALLLVALGYFAATHDWRGPVPVANASIAVLPFENRSAQPDDLYFTDGIHEDILTQLGKIGSLVVISRTSVMQYRGAGKSIPEIAAELGVATILEGGVQRAGNRVRINLQLIEAASDRHLWAETYDRELSAENVFAIQSEIATTIASTLHARLLPAERDRIEAMPTHDLEAYDSYLLGRRQLASRDLPDLEKARDHFGRAVERDPDFALAYAGLADSLVLLALLGESAEIGELAEAEAAARRALELDPDLGEAHTSLGVVLQYQGEPVEVYAPYLARGVELAPGSADARKWFASYLSESKRYDEALEQLEKAVQLDPMVPIVRVNLAGALLRKGRRQEAYAHIRRALEIDPHFMPAVFAISDTMEVDEGLGLLSAALRGNLDNPTVVMHFVLTYLRIGDDVRAGQWAAVLDQHSPDGWQRLVANLNLSLYRSQQDAAIGYASRLVQFENGMITVPSRTLLLDDLRRGEPAAAVARYQAQYPDLLTDDPQVSFNYPAAIDVAMLNQALGLPEKADRLLDRSLEYIATLPAADISEYGVFKARIHAMRGETETALTALREAIDAGWTFHWWFHLYRDPAFDSLRDHPRFQSMVTEMADRARRDLARVREREAAGDIVLPPGVAPGVATPP